MMRRSGSPARSTAGYQQLPNTMVSPVAELSLISLSAIAPLASPPSGAASTSSSSSNQHVSRADASPMAGTTMHHAYPSYPSAIPSLHAAYPRYPSATPSISSSHSHSSHPSATPDSASYPYPSATPSSTASASASPFPTMELAPLPSPPATPAGLSPQSSSGGGRDVTLAKRTNVKPINGHHVFSPPTHSSSSSYRDHDEEEDLLLLTDEDLSIENYMRRHPCILDRGSAFMDRHAWIYQAIVVAFTAAGVACGTLAAMQMQYDSTTILLAYLFILLDLLLFYLASTRSPGHPPHCAEESSVIQLLHMWPASSHHYGLHASEWSRSWSFCEACSNWRPARAHHCSKCGTCVLMMDHHCVWIGQCVGANNMRVFAAYVSATTAISLYGLRLTWKYVTFPQPSAAANALLTSSSSMESTLFLCLLLLFFSLCGLTAAGWLLLRCAWVVLQNESAIEGLKKGQGERKRKMEDATSSKGSAAGGHGGELRKEKMMKNEGGNGSVPNQPHPNGNGTASSSASHQQHVAVVQPSKGRDTTTGTTATRRSNSHKKKSSSSSSSSSSSAALLESGSPDALTRSHGSDPSRRFFSPFQCSCHSPASYRVLYCASFNYPPLSSSATPIPPLPFYFDYDTKDWTLNWFLFWEDLKRMEKLHAWNLGGKQPLPLSGELAKHVRYPQEERWRRECKEQAEQAAKEELKQNAMYM